jgi:hypothetical protein
MDIGIINKNALYREMMVKHGKHHTYLKVSSAIDGDKGSLSRDEAKQLIEIIDESIKAVKKNVLSAIEK